MRGDSGCLHAQCAIHRATAACARAPQVYRRSNVKKSDLLAAKLSSYGSMQDVLRKQEETYGKKMY